MPRKPIAPPVFADTGRPRVLIEATEWASREVLGAILGEQGYDVVGCPGPEGSGARCSLVATGDCTAVVEADVVVHTLRHSDERNREVLTSLRRRYRDTPIVVEVPAPRVERFRADFEGCHVVPYPMTAASLTPAIRTAMAARRVRPAVPTKSRPTKGTGDAPADQLPATRRSWSAQ